MKIQYLEQTIDHLRDTPLVTLLTDSSVSRNHRPLFLPPFHPRWVVTVGMAVRVSRLGKFVAPRFASRYYDAVTLVARLRPEGQQLPASAVDTAFDGAIVIGDWLPLETLDAPVSIEGNINCTVNLPRQAVDEAVSAMSAPFMLKQGDLIVLGDLPQCFTPLIDMNVDIRVNSTPCLDYRIK